MIPIETLVSAGRRAGEATPDLMALRGARIAFAAEPDQEAKLKGGVLKRLASVDGMTGRNLFGPTQTWEPTHTVHIATNHLPTVDDATEGFWRRVVLLGWPSRFRPPDEVSDAPLADLDLPAKLAREAPGILAWAVRGAVAFASSRALHPFPASVRARTDAYRTEEDKLGPFIDERVVYERGATVGVGTLHAEYVAWCDTGGIPKPDRLSQKALSREFYERGSVERIRDATNRVFFAGARLRLSTESGASGAFRPICGVSYGKGSSKKVRETPLNAPDAPGMAYSWASEPAPDHVLEPDEPPSSLEGGLLVYPPTRAAASPHIAARRSCGDAAIASPGLVSVLSRPGGATSLGDLP